MRAGAWAAAAAVVTAAVAVAGCAGRRIEGGVYHAPHGYRVTLPGAHWRLADSEADLELRHRGAKAGMLVNAECRRELARRSPDLLLRHLVLGLRDRAVVERGPATVGGWPAVHAVLEGRMTGSDERVRIESYVVKGDRCVYDLVYVAAPAAFDTGRSDFHRLVQSFAME